MPSAFCQACTTSGCRGRCAYSGPPQASASSPGRSTESTSFRAIRAWAAAFLAKDAEPEAILTAVHAVHAVLRGENLLQDGAQASPALSRRFAGEPGAIGARARDAGAELMLPQRNVEVPDSLVTVAPTNEIAARPTSSKRTVTTRIAAVPGRLEVGDRVAALRYAVLHGRAAFGSVGDGISHRP